MKQESEKQNIEEKVKERIISFGQLPQYLKMMGKVEGHITSKKEYNPSRIYVAPTLIEAGYEFGIPLSAEIQDCYLELEVEEIKTEKGVYDIRVVKGKYGRDLPIAGFDERDVIEKPKRVFLRYATKNFLEELAEDQYYGKIIADLIFGNKKTDCFGRRWFEGDTSKYIDLEFEKRKKLIQKWPPSELKYNYFPSNDFKSSIIDKICHANNGINAGSGTGLIWYYEPIKKNSGKNQDWVIFEMKNDKLIAYPGKELQKEIEKEIETLKKYCRRRLL